MRRGPKFNVLLVPVSRSANGAEQGRPVSYHFEFAAKWIRTSIASVVILGGFHRRDLLRWKACDKVTSAALFREEVGHAFR